MAYSRNLDAAPTNKELRFISNDGHKYRGRILDVLTQVLNEGRQLTGWSYLDENAGGTAQLPPTPSRLPTEAASRKDIPIATGVIDYFPDAICAIAELSRKGNEQHNPGKPLHWDRSKSGDEGDALMRHFVERGTIDTDNVRHSTKVAWRALALLQKEIEAARADATRLAG